MGVDTFRQGLESGDIDAIVDDLAPGFALYSPGRAEPTTDPDLIRTILAAAHATMTEGLRVTGRATGDDMHVLCWTTQVGGHDLEAVGIGRHDDDGRLREFRILMRPLPAVQAWHDAVQARLGSGHG